MHEYIRGERPWAQFYRFLSRLPKHGYFYAEVMEDPEAVEKLLQREFKTGKKSIPLAGWKTEHDLLTTIIDLLNNLHATLIQVNDEKGRRPDVAPMPRPGTALTKVEAKKAIQQHRELVAQFLPQ